MARTCCGLFTKVCVIVLCFVAVSQAFTGDEDARATEEVALARSMRSIPRRGSVGRPGHERIVIDRRPTNRGNRGGGRRRGRGRGGRGRGGRGRGGRGGRGRGGRGGAGRSLFNRRETNLLGRLAEASSTFSLQMYSLLKQNHPEVVFSPYSIHTALTMTYLGARNKTAKQMAKVLGLKRLKKNKAHMAYAALTTSLTDSGNVTLNVANAVYVKPNLPIEETFRMGLQNMYRAEFDQFDMEAQGGPEAPINAWVANKTEDMIQDLLPPGLISPLTALIIVNAIYFKGNWKDPFHDRRTTEQTFYRDDGTTNQVQMMTRTANYNYTHADDLSAHVVELPYQDGRFSMYVILPTSRNELDSVEQRLTLQRLNHHLTNMRSTRVALYLPKFKTESKFSLKETLKTMRMVIPFNRRRATFTGISSVGGLYISDVIHQAVIEVSEEGTEAAAATAVVIGMRSFPRNTVQMRADHPFIYAIRDNISQAWLFMGKYSAQEPAE